MARWVCARGLRGQRLTEGQLDWVYRVTGGYGYTCFRPVPVIRAVLSLANYEAAVSKK